MSKAKKSVPQVRRAALYIKVSTEKQAQKGYSLPAQKEDLEEYARENGYEIVGHYIDEGKSAEIHGLPGVYVHDGGRTGRQDRRDSLYQT